ncbi:MULTISPECIES: C1 family peptidase [unclassified Variovorax]|uniref:C1 family peptidase n=1 Tax=unclassified Variovorax TaxID=663243 RepID=UPI003ECEEC58
MATSKPTPPEAKDAPAYSSAALEWARLLLPVLVSWPLVVLVVAYLFHDTLGGLITRFAQSTEGKAELGPFKMELGKPVLPPQYRPQTADPRQDEIDLSSAIGKIGDTGPEGTTVGFSVAYAIQAAASEAGKEVVVSPRGIYVLSKKYDEWPGENYEGSSLLGAVKAAKEEGVYLEKDWPYDQKTVPVGKKPAFKLKSYAQAKSITAILNALREKKVVALTVQVTEDFDHVSKEGRVTIKLPLRDLGRKTITIVGYDAKTAEFKFANDWGTGWGSGGFGWIKDTDLARILDDGYTVEL